MIYITHNQGASFRNADGACDMKMKRDIILSEIAKLIVRNPKRVIDHLYTVGVKVNGLSHKKLSKAVSQAMHNSPAFAELIATDIAGHHSADGGEFYASGKDKRKAKKEPRKKKRMVKKTNKDGSVSEVEEEVSVDESGAVVDDKKVNVGALLGAIGTIKDSIGHLFGGKKKKTNPDQAKKDLDASEKDLDDKIKTVGDHPKIKTVGDHPGDHGSHIVRNIAIAVGVVLVVSTGIFFAVRSSK